MLGCGMATWTPARAARGRPRYAWAGADVVLGIENVLDRHERVQPSRDRSAAEQVEHGRPAQRQRIDVVLELRPPDAKLA
jgi:hypothetical protein